MPHRVVNQADFKTRIFQILNPTQVKIVDFEKGPLQML
jgi:hypothetical protein